MSDDDLATLRRLADPQGTGWMFWPSELRALQAAVAAEEASRRGEAGTRAPGGEGVAGG